MNNLIINVSELSNFNFNNITLSDITTSNAPGTYCCKICYNNKPLFIHTTESTTKNGIEQKRKKYVTELMFNRESQKIIDFFEKLEDRLKSILFENYSNGISNDDDIDDSFIPITKIYKSGKFYLVKTTNNLNDNLRIYNQKQQQININELKSENKIECVLHIEQVKIAKQIQVEINIKQIGIIDYDLLFDECIINNINCKKERNSNNNSNNILTNKHLDLEENNLKINDLEDSSLEELNLDESNLDETNLDELNLDESNLDETNLEESNLDESNLDETNLDESNLEESNLEESNLDKSNLEESNLEECSLKHVDLKNIENHNFSNTFSNTSLGKSIEIDNKNNNDELLEINIDSINVNNTADKLKIKERYEVYHDLYTSARIKAKEAKKNALLAYLEVKHIKNTYMLDNLYNSDSDFEKEIDNVDESQLCKY